MTSPRTPRQWTEADIVDWPKDHPDVKDRRGTTWRWYPERDFYVTDWNEAASWMQLCKNLGPLSEVLPETPEPPREDPVPPEIYAKHQYNTRQMREPDQLEDLCTCGEWVADWLKHHAEEAAKLHAPVPASQSVPAVPVSSTGGADSGEDSSDAQGTSPPPVPYDEHERIVLEEIDRRDEAEEWADKLAAALAPPHVVGGHSLKNHPWRNALEWAQENRGSLPDSETESKWRAAYEQKLADFARETLRTSELTRERDELRRLLAERETPAEERYAEGDQVEIYTVGRWEPADICRDYGGDRIEARDWGKTVHTCRREDVRRREVTS